VSLVFAFSAGVTAGRFHGGAGILKQLS
jgi:hypothetical protein